MSSKADTRTLPLSSILLRLSHGHISDLPFSEKVVVALSVPFPAPPTVLRVYPFFHLLFRKEAVTDKATSQGFGDCFLILGLEFGAGTLGALFPWFSFRIRPLSVALLRRTCCVARGFPVLSCPILLPDGRYRVAFSFAIPQLSASNISVWQRWTRLVSHAR